MQGPGRILGWLITQGFYNYGTGKEIMRIELIAPSLYNGKKIGKGFLYPPMALMTIAAITPPQHSVTITDENISEVDFDKDVDLVGISVMTSTAPRAYQIAKKFRERGVKVVLGGIHPSLMPDEAVQFTDAVAIGEAEGVWKHILFDAENGGLSRIYKADTFPPASTIPIPRYDLLPRNAYWVKSMVQTTRGCPFNCNFCTVTRFFGGTFRARPVRDVIEQVRLLKSKFIGFVDDNIIGNLKYAAELLTALIKERIYWAGQASVNVVRNLPLLKLLRKSGCKGLFIGFESVSQKTLKEMGKSHNRVKEYKEAIKILHDHGINVQGAFIFGFDSDDKSVFDQTVDFCFDSKIDMVQFALLTPFPGTQLFERLDRENRILTYDWSKYNMSNVLFQPKQMTTDELYEGWNNAYRRFYGRLPILKRILTLGRRAVFGTLPLLVLNLTYRKRVYAPDDTYAQTPSGILQPAPAEVPVPI
jgi:radical SAM superfamily enzyme YgiQ (UPF0313 family)